MEHKLLSKHQDADFALAFYKQLEKTLENDTYAQGFASDMMSRDNF